MQSLILYGSPKKLTNAHKLVSHIGNAIPPNGAKAQPEYYVRMKVLNCGFEDALFHAKPMEGETVLNTVPMP